MLIFAAIFLIAVTNGEDVFGGGGYDGPFKVLFGVLAFAVTGGVFSYILGGLQALAAGLVLSRIFDRQGRVSWLAATLVPALVSAPTFAVFHKSVDAAFILTATGVASSLVLRLAMRRSLGG